MRPKGRDGDLQHNLRACGGEDHRWVQRGPLRHRRAEGEGSARRACARGRPASDEPGEAGRVEALPPQDLRRRSPLLGSGRPSSAVRSPGLRVAPPLRVETQSPHGQGPAQERDRRNHAGSRKNGTHRVSERKKQRVPNVSLCGLLYTGLVRSHVHVSEKTTVAVHLRTMDPSAHRCETIETMSVLVGACLDALRCAAGNNGLRIMRPVRREPLESIRESCASSRTPTRGSPKCDFLAPGAP